MSSWLSQMHANCVIYLATSYLEQFIHVLFQSRMEDCMSIPAGWLCYLSPEVCYYNKINQKKWYITNTTRPSNKEQNKHRWKKLIWAGYPGAQGSPAAIWGLAFHQVFTKPHITQSHDHGHDDAGQATSMHLVRFGTSFSPGSGLGKNSRLRQSFGRWAHVEVFRRQHLGKDVVATFDQYLGYISMFWLFSDHSRSLFIYWPFNVKVGKGIRPTLANLQARRVTFSEQWFLHYLFHVIIISISIFMDIIWWYSEYDLFTWSTAG